MPPSEAITLFVLLSYIGLNLRELLHTLVVEKYVKQTRYEVNLKQMREILEART